MVLLDHLTRGRVMIRASGPGQLTSDAKMLGIDPNDQRRMMEESLEVIVALLRGETVSRKTDWFEIVEGALQLRPYSHPCFELCVAATFSPVGPEDGGPVRRRPALGGRHRRRAGSTPSARTGACIEEESKVHGTTPDRRAWRLMGPMHVAETEEQAIAEVAYGFDAVFDYLSHILPIPPEEGDTLRGPDPGRPTDRPGLRRHAGDGAGADPAAARQVRRLRHLPVHGRRLRHARGDLPVSYELFAREVAPHFRHQLAAPMASDERVARRQGRRGGPPRGGQGGPGLRGREGSESGRELTRAAPLRLSRQASQPLVDELLEVVGGLHDLAVR